MTTSLFRPDDTCWRVERASRMGVIVDAADYFVALREAMIAARDAVYLVGWDFDLRIDMMPGESDENGNAPDGYPNRLGDFFRALIAARPELDLRVLKWDGAMLAAIGKQLAPTLWMQWLSDERIHFQLDSYHPVGACHHSKIVVIDDALAFCGGIDATVDRWDTPDHEPDDPRRVKPDGTPFDPWHDCTTVLEGPVARALGDLARMRWHKATGEDLEPTRGDGPSPWPDSVEAGLRDVDVAIARTAPRYGGDPLVNEIEHLYLALIASAKRHIYMESQYLAAGSLCEALEKRLREPDGPEIVVINPQSAESFLEDEAMHSVRSLMIERLEKADSHGRLRIHHPVNDAGTPIYVHAKVVVVDDRALRIGSSNIDNRSMGFDTECDVAVEATNDEQRSYVAGMMHRLLAEHMGSDADTVAKTIRERGSLVAAIDALNEGKGRGLRKIEALPLDPLERALAETRLFDPRYEERAGVRERAKHAVKRGLSPHQLGGSVSGLGLGAFALVALAGVGIYLLAKRRQQRQPLAAPAVLTDGRLRR